jgi:hypothetical protein
MNRLRGNAPRETEQKKQASEYQKNPRHDPAAVINRKSCHQARLHDKYNYRQKSSEKLALFA